MIDKTIECMPTESNFLALEEEFSSFDNSEIIVLPAPYEYRVSYGHGAALGPESIIKASAFVEFYDDEFDRELCFDKGIATLPAHDFADFHDKPAMDSLKKTISELINNGKFVATLGGEHTISIAPIAAHYKAYPEMSILHFDAHSDLRTEYEGSPYSHACFMARVAEFFPTSRITQVGIRALCIEERAFIRENHINTFFASSIRRGEHGLNWQEKVVSTLGNQVYVTFDIDYFDPSIIPSTGTPEPDGFLYSETMDIFRSMHAMGKKIIGFDIVEHAPIAGLHHPDLTAARLAYKMMNFAF